MRTTFLTLVCALATSQWHVASFRFAGILFVGQRSSTTKLFASKGAPPQTAYSYVEGGDYESRREEIEAMGGDPFFLSDDDEDVVIKDEKDEPFSSNMETPMSGPDPTMEEDRFATDGKGPTPRDPPPKTEVVNEDWEWDGAIDEDAHMMDF